MTIFVGEHSAKVDDKGRILFQTNSTTNEEGIASAKLNRNQVLT